ncbi:hypothetical protein TNCV_884411 [Trichonephila clavipes]|nr:hypothetical protein TNCV_884411 [Trichonephila clavipes]
MEQRGRCCFRQIVGSTFGSSVPLNTCRVERLMYVKLRFTVLMFRLVWKFGETEKEGAKPDLTNPGSDKENPRLIGRWLVGSQKTRFRVVKHEAAINRSQTDDLEATRQHFGYHAKVFSPEIWFTLQEKDFTWPLL